MMPTLNAFLIILGMGAITYSLRASLFLLAARTEVPPYIAGALRYVPAAVLCAIIAPELLMPQGTLDVSLGNARLIAGLVAVCVAWRTRNALVTTAVGMLLLWLLQAVIGAF